MDNKKDLLEILSTLDEIGRMIRRLIKRIERNLNR
jgi:hypothetical protein